MTEAVLKASELPQATPLYAGKYRVQGKLGEGGMGVVYRASELGTGRVVALKQLLSTSAGQRRKSAEALFEREYHTLVRLKHPRIIEVYDYGLSEHGPFYTMELLEGQDLVKARRSAIARCAACCATSCRRSRWCTRTAGCTATSARATCASRPRGAPS